MSSFVNFMLQKSHISGVRPIYYNIKYYFVKAALRLQSAQRRRDDPDEDVNAEMDWALKQAENLSLEFSELVMIGRFLVAPYQGMENGLLLVCCCCKLYSLVLISPLTCTGRSCQASETLEPHSLSRSKS